MRRSLIIGAICLCALAFLTPVRSAFAAVGHSIDELSTQVTVQANASARIVERQIVTFPDSNRGMVWYLHVPESGESVRIDSVRAVPVDDGGTTLDGWTYLQMIDSNPRQQGRDPGDIAAPYLRGPKVQPWYSYNIGDGMIRCYFPTGADANTSSNGNASAATVEANADESAADYHTYLIEIDYTVLHRVRVFRDVGELYWRYANDSLPVDAHDVNLQVMLPLPDNLDPASAAALMNQDVQAWGHSPDGGSFSIGADGSVTYHIDEVQQGNYADAHIVFPANWLTSVPENAANQFSETRRAAAAAEEAEWVDEGTRGANWDNKVRVLFLVLAVIVVLVGTASVIRHGRTPRSRLALIRTATTLAIVALGEHLFFHEPLTTALLALLAAIVAAISLTQPTTQDCDTRTVFLSQSHEGEPDERE